MKKVYRFFDIDEGESLDTMIAQIEMEETVATMLAVRLRSLCPEIVMRDAKVYRVDSEEAAIRVLDAEGPYALLRGQGGDMARRKRY